MQVQFGLIRTKLSAATALHLPHPTYMHSLREVQRPKQLGSPWRP